MKTGLVFLLLLGNLGHLSLLAKESLLTKHTVCDFNCTLSKHLDAIQARDFKAFESTITPTKKISFILPNGKFFDDSENFRKMLKDWFAQDGWTFNYKIIAKEHSDTLGYALLLVSYDEKERAGKPYHIDHYLNLIFKKIDGHWYLIHDQNTKTELKSQS